MVHALRRLHGDETQELPQSMHHDDIRNEKIKVLKALRPSDPATVGRVSVRGQYA
ncbi:MAG: hypothetical protein AAFV30_12350, partial [Pseudomonadota bacterium]